MVNSLEQLSNILGKNITILRNKRSLTQQELAKLAGIPRSTITNLESGLGNPSLHNLVKIALAFQVSVEELMSIPRSDCKLVKNKDLPSKARSQGAAQVFNLLIDSIPGMHIDRIELKAKTKMTGVPHLRGTKEYITCVQGSFMIYVGGEKFKVEKGDVLAFPGDQNHSYENLSDTTSIGVSIVALSYLPLQ